MKKTDLKDLTQSASDVKSEVPNRRSSVQRFAEGSQRIHNASMSLVQSSTPKAMSLGFDSGTNLRDEIRAIHDMILHPKACYEKLRKIKLFEDDKVDHTKDADYLFDIGMFRVIHFFEKSTCSRK